MIVKWQTHIWTEEIRRQECTRETAKSVWIMYAPLPVIGDDPPEPVELEHDKVCGRCDYHDTWEHAHDHLLADAYKKVSAARRALDRCNSYYSNVHGLKKPEGSCDG